MFAYPHSSSAFKNQHKFVRKVQALDFLDFIVWCGKVFPVSYLCLVCVALASLQQVGSEEMRAPVDICSSSSCFQEEYP